MPRRLVVFAALAVVLAAIFVRLGVWQLSRLQERRAFNAERARPLTAPELPFDSLRERVPYRRVTLAGAPDFEREFALSGRSRNGSPGVHVVTPYRRAGNDTAVLVIRGWVYAPDAASADLPRFRGEAGGVRGYTDTLPAGPGSVDARRARVLRRLTTAGVAELVPYPVAPLVVVSRDSAGPAAPARLPLPELHDGPHLGYAIQWFAFALTALVGAAIVLARGRRERDDGSTAAMRGTRQR